jgi:hypothetical protein
VDDQGTQRLDDDQAGEWLPLADAAPLLGVSVKTARRRLKAGELTSRQVATQHGQAYEVWVTRNGHTSTQTSTVNAVGTQRVDDVTTVELVRLVDRLQRENRDLAGLVGSLQERNANLEAQLALPAPISQERPFLRDSDGVAVEATQTPSERRDGRPWWAFWRT